MCSGVDFLLTNLYICICGLTRVLPADCCRVDSSLWMGWVYMLKDASIPEWGRVVVVMGGGLKIDRLS